MKRRLKKVGYLFIILIDIIIIPLFLYIFYSGCQAHFSESLFAMLLCMYIAICIVFKNKVVGIKNNWRKFKEWVE
jgi:hypothetical protein